jgi:transcriptional regulator PpsR
VTEDNGHKSRNPPAKAPPTKPSIAGEFLSPQTALGHLDPGSAASLISVASDITLIVDADGIIRDLSIQNEELLAELEGGRRWIGMAFRDTVSSESRSKVSSMLLDHARSEVRWRHINQVTTDGHALPILYCSVPLGQQGRMVVFGRDMRAFSALQQRLMNAQASLEQDYSRLRDAEVRYRLLFQTSSETVLIVDPSRGRIVEANPAAREMFGADLREVVGHPLLSRFERTDAVEQYINAVRNGESPEDLTTHLLHGQREVLVRATAFRQDAATMLLVRISSAHAVAAAASLSVVKSKLLRAVENAPDGFVVTDNDGAILTANAAFLEMAGIVSEDAARGQALDQWVGDTGVDLTVLIANLRQRGSVRFFATTLRSEAGAVVQVEISAVSIANGGKPSFGFAIRNVAPRLRMETKAGRTLPRSVEQLQELIGRVALKDLVREATEVIERLSIEAALELTNDNRASAAEMLGLSRQSLYVKLRRYGIGDLDPAESS